MTIKITYITDDWGEGDWEGLAINGEVLFQNHSIDYRAVFEELAKRGAIQFEHIVADPDWLLEQRHLPNDVSEIKLYDETKPQSADNIWLTKEERKF